MDSGLIVRAFVIQVLQAATTEESKPGVKMTRAGRRIVRKSTLPVLESKIPCLADSRAPI